MRLYQRGGQIYLDPEPLDADSLRRNARFKMTCRAYVRCVVKGHILLEEIGNYTEFEKIVGKLSKVASRLGVALSVDEDLQDGFTQIRELAEQRSRLGNEIKRGDHKHDAHLAEFSEVVDAAMARPLKDRQMRDAFFLATMGRAGNFSVPGSGKTATVLGAFAFLAARSMVDRIMVVCPKNAFDSWATEWGLCFGDKRPLSLFTTQDDAYRKLGKSDRRSYIRARVGGCNLLLVNYEAAIGVAEELSKVAGNRTLLVFDEIHRVKRVGGKQANAALVVSKSAPYTFALTGTPIPNGYNDIYNMLHILYPREYDNFFGFEKSELKNAEDSDIELVNNKLQPFYCRTTKDDLGVPRAEPDELIKVSSGERTNLLLGVIKNRYRRNKLTLMLRVLQMENDPIDLLETLNPEDYRWIIEEDEETGEVDAVDYSDKIVGMIRSAGASSKRARCCSLIGDLVAQGRSVIVWCIFIKSMSDLQRGLAGMGIEARTINGQDDLVCRSADLDDFRAGKFPVLITNPHTLAESVSLHSICHDAVYYEYSFNLVHLLQSRDRIHRLGLPQDQQTRYYYLSEDYDLGKPDPWSLDEEIYTRLREKENTMLRCIDSEILETQPTSQEDLDAIFAGLFDD